jgi:AraC-like DNA-binding protein
VQQIAYSQLDDAADGVRTLLAMTRFGMSRGEAFGAHEHEDHQILWAPTGVAHVEVGDDRWVLPPTQALWIPGGVVHEVRAARTAVLHSLYFWPGACPIEAPAPRAVEVTPLTAELLDLVGAPGVAPTLRAHAEALLLGLLEPVRAPVVTLRQPRDDRARGVADGLLADPRDGRDLAAWGREVGASSRTLARLFLAETGMTFADWRMRMRVRASLDHLAAGAPVAVAAGEVGYRSPSAFAAAFARVTGRTPTGLFSGR